MSLTLITSVYGGYDPVCALPEDHGFDDAICVTDGLSEIGAGWRVIVDHQNVPARLAAKRPKMLPWLYCETDCAVWLDASFEVNGSSFAPWCRETLDRKDFVVWVHPEGRIDIRDEVAVCWDFPKYADQPLKEQLATYVADGMPEHWGLFAAGTIGYRFTDRVREFGQLWYDEQLKWSIQDQVSLPYLLWRTGMGFGLWKANEYNNPYVTLRWDQRPRPQD